MNNIDISKIEKDLDALGIVPATQLIFQDGSHNSIITDENRVFIKLLSATNTVSHFITEVEAVSAIGKAEELLIVPNVVYLDGHAATVWHYVKGEPLTATSMWPSHAAPLVDSLVKLHRVDPNQFTNLSSLDLVLTTVKRRLGSEKAALMPESIRNDFSKLIKRVIIPTLDLNYDNIVPCHSDAHPENLMLLEDEEVQLIDYESVKLVPREYDLAPIYQALMQVENNPKTWEAVVDSFKSYYALNEKLLNRLISLRNVSTATYAIQFGNWNVVGSRVEAILDGFSKGKPADSLAQISSS